MPRNVVRLISVHPKTPAAGGDALGFGDTGTAVNGSSPAADLPRGR